MAHLEKTFLENMRRVILNNKQQIAKHSSEEKPVQAIVHVDELKLAQAAEKLEVVLGGLDGKLSLLNATTFVEIDD
jgi:hypothetical protein